MQQLHTKVSLQLLNLYKNHYQTLTPPEEPDVHQPEDPPAGEADSFMITNSHILNTPDTPERTRRWRKSAAKASLHSSLELTPKRAKYLLNSDQDKVLRMVKLVSDNPVDVLQHAQVSVAFINKLSEDIVQQEKEGSNVCVVSFAKKLSEVLGSKVVS